MEGSGEVAVRRLPFELRPAPQPTLRPEGEYLRRAWSQSVYPLAIRMGVEIRMPTISPQPHTHLAFEGLQFAKENGRENAYNERVLCAFFQDNQDIGQVDVLTRVAAGVGLNPDHFREALETRRYREQHQQSLRHAYEEAKIRAVPTFLIGQRRLVGMQSEETLRECLRGVGV